MEREQQYFLTHSDFQAMSVCHSSRMIIRLINVNMSFQTVGSDIAKIPPTSDEATTPLTQIILTARSVCDDVSVGGVQNKFGLDGIMGPT